MSTTTHALAKLVRSRDLAPEERAALTWALHQAALDDEAARECRGRLALALQRLEEASEAEHSARAAQILVREMHAEANRLLSEVCGMLLDDSGLTLTP